MCTGVEIALIGSSVLAASGAVMQGQQQKDMADYQAAQTDADAHAAKTAAKVEAERIRKAGRRQAAQANAALAGSGVETGEGTALRITSDITEGAEHDAYMTVINGANTASRYRAQAQADRISGNNAATAGYLGAGGSLLKAGASAYNGWKKAKQGKYGLFSE